MKILLLYFFVALFVLRGIIFAPGALLGGDWSLPFALSQMRFWFENWLYTWTNGNLFGIEQFLLHGLPFYVLIGVLAGLGITGEVYIKLLLVLFFALPAFTMHLLGRFLGCSGKVAILGGVLYLTLPFFFNYAAIGWILILFSTGILPLVIITFVKSVATGRVLYSVLTGLLYSLAMIQPQSLVWYLLVFLFLAFYLIRNKRTFFVYLRSLLVVFFVFLTLGAFWELPLFLGGGSGALTTKLGLSTVSLGTWAKLSNLNILRGWGSLFNYQYETSQLPLLRPLSFVLPLLAYSSLVFLRKKKIIYSFILLSFVPVILFSLGPNFIVRLPFSDLIRDMGRFSVISSFSYVVLAVLVLDFIVRHKQKWLGILGIALCSLLVINAYPFWSGELFGAQRETQDIRLRTYHFPKEYIFLEKFLAEENRDVKVLYLPLGGALNALDDKRFYGAYKEIRDIFASFSPKPGEIGISDKGMGSATDLIFKLKEIQDSRQFDDLSKLLDLMGVKYVAVRKNVDSSRNISGEEIASLLDKRVDLTPRKDLGKISLFENNSFLPHFYIPQNIIYSNGGVASLPEILSFGGYSLRPGIYLSAEQTEIEKLRNLEILEKADEVFIKADLEDMVSEEELEVATGPKEVFLPHVRRKPGSFLYPLILKKEEFDKWKLRNDPEKLFEKHLFYASKRIAEMIKYADNADKNQITRIVGFYREETMGALGEIKKLETTEIWKKMLAKFAGTLEGQKEKIEDVDNADMGAENAGGGWGGVFRELEKRVGELKPQRDFSKLVYKIDIPKTGNYSLFINEINGVDINELTGLTDLEEEGGWVKWGERDFEKGPQELVLPMRGISENLVDENLKIRDYQPDAIYRISFDYQAPKGGGFFVAEGKEGKVAETNLPATGDEFKHFEMFFKSSLAAEEGTVHLSISVAEEKNLEVRRIYQPEVMLRMDADNADTERITRIMPKITFIKINPTKYRVKVERAKEPYILVFSESFHQGWKAYISEVQSSKFKVQNDFGNILASYFNGDIKEGTHKNIFLDGNTFETWGKEPLPEDKHLLVNGYANSWYIEPEDASGRENYEIIIEFAPQRLFYIGLGISLVTLLGCLGYLGGDFIRRRKKWQRIH